MDFALVLYIVITAMLLELDAIRCHLKDIEQALKQKGE